MTSALKSATVDRPEVSIVIIAFNERERAPECISAVLAQRADARFEVILVDDGSTDGMAESLLDRFGDEPRLTVVRLPMNRGRGAARATGVEVARGRLIAFVDADITLPDFWLAHCMAALPGHAAVGGIAVPDGECAALHRLFRLEAKPRPGTAGVTGNNVLFDGAVLRDIGFDRTSRLGEDFRLAKRISAAGLTVSVLPELTVQHREVKTYGRSLRWLFDSGIDASRLLAEFGEVRVPDVTWAGWLALSVTGLVVGAGRSRWWLLTPLAATAGVTVGHMATRFAFRASPVRWFTALVADVPLMGAYLVGRTLGLRELRPASRSSEMTLRVRPEPWR